MVGVVAGVAVGVVVGVGRIISVRTSGIGAV